MADSTALPITLRVPSKYASAASPSPSSTFTPPPIEWLHRTWSVTHSTLSMWRSARNVRITYAPLTPKASNPPLPRIDDLVEYEKASGKGGVKSVAGVDTAAAGPSGSSGTDTGAWDWRGKGWLFFVGSHWEVLGWGERPLADGSGGVERWVVTWFAPTVFTKEGVDVYSDRREGGGAALVGEILHALKKSEVKELAAMCEKDMRPVEIKLPWKEN